MSIRESVIVQKCTTKDESGKILFNPIVKLSSHEDTLRPGKILPAKCHKDEYETLEKDRRPSATWNHFYESARYCIAVKELITGVLLPKQPLVVFSSHFMLKMPIVESEQATLK